MGVKKRCAVYYGLLNGPVVVFCIAAVAKPVLRACNSFVNMGSE
jgi:hypothetical protein